MPGAGTGLVPSIVGSAGHRRYNALTVRVMTSLSSRPWTRFYAPETAQDSGAPRLAHGGRPGPRRVAEYASNRAFSLLLPNGTTGHLTFAEVDALSDAFAVYLREVAGLRAGDRLAVQMPNCLAYPIVIFGALKASLVTVNTNPLYTAPEMEHQFADSGATGLVVIDLFADKVAQVLPKTAIRTVIAGDHRRPAAVADPHGGPHGAAPREETGAADHLRARHLRRAIAEGPAA